MDRIYIYMYVYFFSFYSLCWCHSTHFLNPIPSAYSMLTPPMCSHEYSRVQAPHGCSILKWNIQYTWRPWMKLANGWKRRRVWDIRLRTIPRCSLVDGVAWFYRASRNLKTAAFPPCFIFFPFFCVEEAHQQKKGKRSRIICCARFTPPRIHTILCTSPTIWHAANDVGSKHEWNTPYSYANLCYTVRGHRVAKRYRTSNAVIE